MTFKLTAIYLAILNFDVIYSDINQNSHIIHHFLIIVKVLPAKKKKKKNMAFALINHSWKENSGKFKIRSIDEMEKATLTTAELK